MYGLGNWNKEMEYERFYDLKSYYQVLETISVSSLIKILNDHV